MEKTQIGFLIYPDVIQLDVMAAYQVLAFPPNTELHLISKTLDPIISNEGLIITPTVTLEKCPTLDVIFVPGGGMEQAEVMADSQIINFLSQQANTARYITSVCTGSLILAVANLLQNYQATCHWAFDQQLKTLGVTVVKERIVIDRDRITAAGVTSGIDLGLVLLNLLYGEETAKMAQLMLEYAPQPPFNAGTPENAGEKITKSLLEFGKPLIKAFDKQIRI